jgi:phage terminase large subunit-like protein
VAASLAERLAEQPVDQRDPLLDSFTDSELEALLVDWLFWARPEQQAPDWAWRWWVMITGRGWGKNRTGAEWVVDRCEQFAAAGHEHLVGLIGQNNDDVKALQIRGVSGIREVVRRRGHRWKGADSSLNPQIGVLRPDGDPGDPNDWHWSQLEVHSAIEPEGPRGRNFHTLWVDELAAFKHKTDAAGNTVFSNAELALRGSCPPLLQPQGVITTTPKPVPVIRDLLAEKHGPTHVTRGSMFDNRANLPGDFIDAVVGRYKGTRLEAQEILGMVIDSVEGALWTPELIQRWRLGSVADVPSLERVVVGVDPSGSDAHGDTCGIVVAGISARPDRRGLRHLYTLDDASDENRPEVWARAVVDAYHRWNAKAVVAEVNFGAAMVADVIHLTDRTVVVEEVRASKGKRVRAEPVALLYDAGQGRAHHVGTFPLLEEQMAYWTPKDPTSPDRMDALVWAACALMPDLTVPPADYVKGFAERRLAA